MVKYASHVSGSGTAPTGRARALVNQVPAVGQTPNEPGDDVVLDLDTFQFEKIPRQIHRSVTLAEALGKSFHDLLFAARLAEDAHVFRADLARTEPAKHTPAGASAIQVPGGHADQDAVGVEDARHEKLAPRGDRQRRPGHNAATNARANASSEMARRPPAGPIAPQRAPVHQRWKNRVTCMAIQVSVTPGRRQAIILAELVRFAANGLCRCMNPTRCCTNATFFPQQAVRLPRRQTPKPLAAIEVSCSGHRGGLLGELLAHALQSESQPFQGRPGTGPWFRRVSPVDQSRTAIPK